jgi:hypothetical protein
MAGLDPYTNVALTEALSKIAAPQSFVLDAVFGRIETHPTQAIDIDISIGNKLLAPFVSPVEGGIVVKKLGREVHSIKCPRIRLKTPLSAQDLLLGRAPGTDIYIVGGGNVTNARNQKIALEQQNLKDRITRRKEWMACQALAGKITVDQDNYAFEIDYQLPGAHKPTLAGANKWSDSSANPIKDIRAWKTLINQASGLNADLAICGANVVDALLENAMVQKLLDNRQVSVGNLAITNTNFIGTIAGVQIYEYSAMYDDDSGTSQYLIPGNAFVLVSRQARLVLHYGAILDLQSTVQGPYFSKMWEDNDPSTYWLLAESSPLPVVHQPEGLVFATVL